MPKFPHAPWPHPATHRSVGDHVEEVPEEGVPDEGLLTPCGHGQVKAVPLKSATQLRGRGKVLTSCHL